MSAYNYQLLIKQLLHTPLANAPDQEIVYRDLVRYDYRTLVSRIARLGSALSLLPGQTVAVMDWDSHRYLECFFAIPMLGGVLQTVNVRLPADQIVYTLNHARADVLLVHEDFLPLLASIKDRLETVSRFVLLSDSAKPDCPPPFSVDYETLLSGGNASLGHTLCGHDAGCKTSVTGALSAGCAARADQARRRDLFALRADDTAFAAGKPDDRRG